MLWIWLSWEAPSHEALKIQVRILRVRKYLKSALTIFSSRQVDTCKAKIYCLFKSVQYKYFIPNFYFYTNRFSYSDKGNSCDIVLYSLCHINFIAFSGITSQKFKINGKITCCAQSQEYRKPNTQFNTQARLLRLQLGVDIAIKISAISLMTS